MGIIGKKLKWGNFNDQLEKKLIGSIIKYCRFVLWKCGMEFWKYSKVSELKNYSNKQTQKKTAK